MTRTEYREGYLCVRDYKINFLGFTIYKAKFTTTNNEALRLLTVRKEAHTEIKGFNN